LEVKKRREEEVFIFLQDVLVVALVDNTIEGYTGFVNVLFMFYS